MNADWNCIHADGNTSEDLAIPDILKGTPQKQ